MSSKKVGRPVSDKPKSKTMKIRLDKETLRKLDEASQNLNTIRSDTVRKGIEELYNYLILQK